MSLKITDSISMYSVLHQKIPQMNCFICLRAQESDFLFDDTLFSSTFLEFIKITLRMKLSSEIAPLKIKL